jgi:hypothetical protein
MDDFNFELSIYFSPISPEISWGAKSCPRGLKPD